MDIFLIRKVFMGVYGFKILACILNILYWVFCLLLWNFLHILLILQVSLFTGPWSDNPDPENYLKKVACDPEKLWWKPPTKLKIIPKKAFDGVFLHLKRDAHCTRKKINFIGPKDSPFNCMELDKDDIIHLRELLFFEGYIFSISIWSFSWIWRQFFGFL